MSKHWIEFLKQTYFLLKIYIFTIKTQTKFIVLSGNQRITKKEKTWKARKVVFNHPFQQFARCGRACFCYFNKGVVAWNRSGCDLLAIMYNLNCKSLSNFTLTKFPSFCSGLIHGSPQKKVFLVFSRFSEKNRSKQYCFTKFFEIVKKECFFFSVKNVTKTRKKHEELFFPTRWNTKHIFKLFALRN